MILVGTYFWYNLPHAVSLNNRSYSGIVMRNKQTIIALSTVVAAIVLLVYPLGATHQAHAILCKKGQDCDVNSPTGNPHATAGPGDANPGTIETGNPHTSQSCTEDPHDQIGFDTCPGSK